MSKLEYRAMQELKYRSGQIDRRTFVRSLLATGVALPSALSLAGQVLHLHQKAVAVFVWALAMDPQQIRWTRNLENHFLSLMDILSETI